MSTETRIELIRNIVISVFYFLRNKFSGVRMAMSYEVFNCPPSIGRDKWCIPKTQTYYIFCVCVCVQVKLNTEVDFLAVISESIVR